MGLPINDRFQRPVKAGRFLSFGGCKTDCLVDAPRRALLWRGDSSLGSETAGMQVQFVIRNASRCRMPKVCLIPGG
jgi:hypothetical protein